MADDSWREVPDAVWMPRAKVLGFDTALDSGGAESATWLLEQVRLEAIRIGEPFTEGELTFLSRHMFSNDASQAYAIHINDKVVRTARSAVRRMLADGKPSQRIGRFGPRWPAEWLERYKILIASNHPMTVTGPLQNAMSRGSKPWRP